ncbi:multicopper oxidase domain-containing protein [Geobacter sp. DSM 9736]|uniref:multicopper oxidase domain-containing protein n=1 Tax=Geobacter sp. DSM 9736 TaxID=1277350 RepID=UPI000B51376F|nr:multicopper oxidase domain-containing protein [Geobacter sp. DSM 9736]SNB44962.1 Multicopper oxidase [Geobacter sp. DSM 9736]
MPVIPRDIDHPLNEASYDEMIRFWQHGVAQPTSVALLDPNNTKGFEPPPNLAAGQPPSPNDRRLTMLSANFRNNVLAPILDPAAPLPTPDSIPTPARTFELSNVAGGGVLPVPYPTKGGANTLEVWGFNASGGAGETWFPGTTIRVREGELVHSFLGPKFGSHTIHHHGVEPTPMNDGVGHATFLVGEGGYTYQWIAPEAGTYFYHCHKNTVLHFEMGMYGLLISDPDVPGAPFIDGGSGMVYRRDSLRSYQREVFWVIDDFDSRWHEDVIGMGHSVGIGTVGNEFLPIGGVPENSTVQLHRFDPDYFLVSGVIADPQSQAGGRQNVITNPSVSPTAQRGETLLFRVLNASYTSVTINFPAHLNPEVIAMDGRTLGRAPFVQYSNPFSMSSIGGRMTLSTAQRWDLLLNTNVPAGTYFVDIEYRHWVTQELLRTISIPVIIVS